ncbi:hypothetical protein [Pararhizobium haloflavum]|uniref:hypothetical protein n=1 Tax=Pararhizobium haloflavum TaxID=2037914 RepID=UPI000C1A4132|nr:hypothetical protein [Pararhizobium haloflavum]
MSGGLYSAEMLRLFLEARIVFRMQMHGESRKQAMGRLFRTLAKASRLSVTRVAIAHRGSMNHPEHRAALWLALGYPAAPAAIEEERAAPCEAK